jgi:hypothetical protein
VTPAEARVVVFDREVENRLAALLGRLPRARSPPLGKALRLSGGLPLQPSEQSIEVTFGGNESPPDAL